MGPNKKPKLLPCQHTVCEHCVDRLQSRICPIDREPFSENSSKDLPTNLSILQLIDFTKNINKSSTKIMCEFCPDESYKISHFCKYCNEYFCSDCAKGHREMCLKNAMPQCIDNNSCLVHQKAFTIFCMDCNTLLCMVCAQNKTCCSSNNKKHIEKMKIKKTRELKRLIIKLSSEIQWYEDTILPSDTALKSTIKTIKEIKLGIKIRTKKLVARLVQRGKELMDEVNEYEAEIKKLQQSVSHPGLDLETSTKLKQTADAALTGGIVPILLTLPNIQAVVPQTAITKTKIFIPGNITFKPLRSMKIGNLHKDLPKYMDQRGRSCNSIISNVFRELFYLYLFLSTQLSPDHSFHRECNCCIFCNNILLTICCILKIEFFRFSNIP